MEPDNAHTVSAADGGALPRPSRQSPLPRRRYFGLITVAGCLAMVYGTCVASPLTVSFFRDLGATDMHFALLGGLPMVMLVMQFVGAYLANRVPRRRPWFIGLGIAARLLYVPLALLPLIPGVCECVGIPFLILLVVASSGIGNLVGPIWLSWMGDLIPRSVLNRFWGGRQRYLMAAWTLAYWGVGLFAFRFAHLSPRHAFPILVVVGGAAGVTDLLLFLRVPEPENLRTSGPSPWKDLSEPLRHRDYRTLVLFTCLFAATTNLAAVFMQLFVLKVLNLAVWKTTLAWSMYGVGTALVAPTWGRIADRYGHRPILRVCTVFKPLICLVYLLVTPSTAFLVLTISFFFDSMLNSGNEIAVTGYMLKMAPRENRAMFIAANSALSGIAAGLGGILGGVILRYTVNFAPDLLGRQWSNYHLLFLISLVLRLFCIPLAGAVREPTSAPSRVVVGYLMDLWPGRLLALPAGLYRRWRSADEA
jgi:MFS family permease